jgi:hypothetical protein
MLSAIEQLMRFHAASHFGSLERPPSDYEAFEELESRHLRVRPEPERSEPAWRIGDVAAAVALLVVFCGVLAVIAGFAGFAVESQNTMQQPVVALSDSAERR